MSLRSYRLQLEAVDRESRYRAHKTKHNKVAGMPRHSSSVLLVGAGQLRGRVTQAKRTARAPRGSRSARGGIIVCGAVCVFWCNDIGGDGSMLPIPIPVSADAHLTGRQTSFWSFRVCVAWVNGEGH